MSWQDQADAVMKICRDTFTTNLTYTPSVGAPFALAGIFDAAYQQIEMLDGAAVQSTQPMLGVRLRDFPAPPREGDRCTINAQLYRVSSFEPDGEAGARLLLHKL